MTTLKDVSAAITNLLDSEDDTGCSDDLTVCSKSACEKLRTILEEIESTLAETPKK